MLAHQRFEGTVASVPAARHWLVDQLTGVGRHRNLDDAATCLSELASNVVDHTDNGFEVTLSDGDGAIRVEVTDCDRRPPLVRRIDPYSDRGRGLVIVEALASRWGVEDPADEGKTVWFELD